MLSLHEKIAEVDHKSLLLYGDNNNNNNNFIFFYLIASTLVNTDAVRPEAAKDTSVIPSVNT